MQRQAAHTVPMVPLQTSAALAPCCSHAPPAHGGSLAARHGLRSPPAPEPERGRAESAAGASSRGQDALDARGVGRAGATGHPGPLAAHGAFGCRAGRLPARHPRHGPAGAPHQCRAVLAPSIRVLGTNHLQGVPAGTRCSARSPSTAQQARARVWCGNCRLRETPPTPLHPHPCLLQARSSAGQRWLRMCTSCTPWHTWS